MLCAHTHARNVVRAMRTTTTTAIKHCHHSICMCVVCVPMISLCKWLNWIFVYFRLVSQCSIWLWLNGILFSYFNQTTTGSMMLSLILKYIYARRHACTDTHNKWNLFMFAFAMSLHLFRYFSFFLCFWFVVFFYAFQFTCLHSFFPRNEKSSI